MRFRVIAYSLLALSLSSCATQKLQPATRPGDDATVKLAEAADSISNSLLDLARIQAVATPPAKGKSLPNPATYGMQSRASVDWAGPVAPIVEKIATASNYKVRILGKAPAIPVLISLSAKNAPLADILRDVDFQAGKKANIVVYPKSRVIELRYAQA